MQINGSTVRGPGRSQPKGPFMCQEALAKILLVEDDRAIREKSGTPVLIVSNRSRVPDRVLGLNLGAAGLRGYDSTWGVGYRFDG